MGVIKLVLATALAATLTGCGEGTADKSAADEAPAASLAAGLYEVSAEVTQLASTDNSAPATKLKQGDKLVTRACVNPDGKPEGAMLAEDGDKCDLKNSYIRNGRLNAEMSCTRDGKSGSVMPALNGSFSKDAFEGSITTLTYFVDDGDYRMSRKVAAKRVGDCPAGGAAGDPKAATEGVGG